MNVEQTLALYRDGVAAWNAWASVLLEERTRLKENNQWTSDTRLDWHERAAADFSGLSFQEPADFAGYCFPARADFSGATFENRVSFEKATFSEATHLSNTPRKHTDDTPSALAQLLHEVTFDRCCFRDSVSFARVRFANVVSFCETEFHGRLLFQVTAFLSDVYFVNTRFHASSHFEHVRFDEGLSVFEGATFATTASFDDCSFHGDTWFSETIFSGPVAFLNVRFEALLTTFRDAEFHERATFRKTVFRGQALFSRAQSAKSILFLGSDFENPAGFDAVDFSGRTVFNTVKFSAAARFDAGNFTGRTVFQNAMFSGVADFSAIRATGHFSLSDVTFTYVPDFSQAHFESPLGFDWLGMKPPRSWAAGLDPEASVVARWRALKSLAIQGCDYERELQFFRGELRARRGREDPVTGAFFWIGWMYEILSDFGLSVSRPLALLVASLVAFGTIHAKQSPYLWSEVAFSLAFGTRSAEVCNPGASAAVLSLDAAFPFLGISGEAASSAQDCLYSQEYLAISLDERPAGRSDKRVPTKLALVEVTQFFVSSTLLFLVLLAIRNRFRVS
ncbi:MAG: hypothetical protein F4060_17075 [Holophagales bacterium]|nr:hypothetical protein [Holophagales bacterium]MYG30695.1 hypothetical protein [Holophagales bacterium]MYI81635.1 hypothetical protein [Holophagales bacterium]